MLSRVSSCLALLILSVNIAAAATLQERKLPSPAVFETVLPHLVFGNLGSARYETILLLANPENRPAQIEFDFRYADGRTAAELLYPGGALYPTTGRAAKNGLFYFEIAPHAVLELAFPGKDAELFKMEFNGWASVRSNTRIFASQTSRVIDDRSVSSEARYAAAQTATKYAEIEVTNTRWEPVGEGSAQWWGWNHEQSGITLVNPFSAPVSVSLTLKNSTREVQLAGQTKRAFLISELFPEYHGAFSYDMSHILSLETQTDTGFVVLGLDSFVTTWPDGLPRPGPDRPWLSFSLPRLNIPGGAPFAFTDEIRAESPLGDWRVFVSNLGFVITGLSGQPPKVFPLNMQHSYAEALGITTDETLGIGVIHGADEIPVVFPQTGHVLTIPDIGYGGPPTIIATGEPDQVRVIFGKICQIRTYVIDVKAEKLVSKKYEWGNCPL
ncbi:MAG: hypothetical protein EHM61_25735 [Acidobacteria bacterium]|nr:MAG: hypothetical protein EHM61_25735 [Acidobacteriota bacterium]